MGLSGGVAVGTVGAEGLFPVFGMGEDVEVVVACLPESPLGTTESDGEFEGF